MKRSTVVLLILVLIGIAAGVGMRFKAKDNMKKAQLAESKKASKGVPVETVFVMRGDIEAELSIYGTLKGKNEVPIYPKVGGRVLQMFVENGDRVRKGQILAQLETKEIMDHVRQAEAAVDGARAGVQAASEQYKLVLKGARPQERLQMENSVAQAKQAFDIAQSNLTRMQNLLESGVISQQQFDSVKLNYDMAKTGYENAKQQMSIVNVGARDEEKGMAKQNLKMAEEGLRQAEAALSFAREQNKNASITSPTAGIVSTSIIDPGTMVGPTMQYPMMTIVDDSSFSINSDISEVDLDKVRIGQTVNLTIDAIPGRKFEGVITEINPSVSMGTRTYTVKVEVKNNDRLPKSGMFARGTITVVKHTGTLIVPKDAVIKKGGEYHGIFVVKNGAAKYVEIKAGILNTVNVEILSGVNEGDEIVVVGAAGLADGDKVIVSSAGKATK